MINYKTKAQPLDIIIVYNPKSWLHRLIYRVTEYKAGHVALYLSDGIICEANSTGVHRKPWKNYKDGMRVYLARPIGMTEGAELKIRKMAFDCENYLYSFGQLFAYLIKTVFHLRHVPESRDKGSDYRHEMTIEQHVELSETLHSLNGNVIISGYPSELYEEIYSDWECIKKSALADGARKRVECLWIKNYNVGLF